MYVNITILHEKQYFVNLYFSARHTVITSSNAAKTVSHIIVSNTTGDWAQSDPYQSQLSPFASANDKWPPCQPSD
jgi:hypothetical protein